MRLPTKNGCGRKSKKPQKRSVFKAFLGLVRMTGFEPTRISSLEPETSASAVPPHPHFLVFVLYFYTGRTPETVLTIELGSFSILRRSYTEVALPETSASAVPPHLQFLSFSFSIFTRGERPRRCLLFG